MELREIPATLHAERVLPVSASLWAGRRDVDTYVRQTLEIARSAYGKKFYRLFALFDGKSLVASCKRYERTIRNGNETLRAFGIGAVFTPPEARGQGYASAMLGAALDTWRAEGADIVYLFSDIRPQFYEEIGFVTLPSRAISLRSDTLPSERIVVETLQEKDWPGVARAFEAVDARRAWGFERSATVWNWVRMRMAHGSEHTTGSDANLVVRRRRGIAAYVLGVRAPEHDAYVLDEYGYATPDDAALIAPLLRSAAGDLRRIVGWLPPDGARDILPRGAVRKRKDAIFMAVSLTSPAKRWFERACNGTLGDGVWATDHI